MNCKLSTGDWLYNNAVYSDYGGIGEPTGNIKENLCRASTLPDPVGDSLKINQSGHTNVTTSLIKISLIDEKNLPGSP